jgi:MFS family permease
MKLRSLTLDLSPLTESKSYRALWIGLTVSMIGTNMRFVAVPWQVYELTGSVAAVGLIGLVEVVPLIIFSIIGGAIADRADRKALIVWMQSGMLAAAAGLAALTLMDRPPLWGIYALVALSSSFSAVENPARSSMLPALISKERLPSALALRQVSFQTTLILGPAIGGLLIATFDLGWVYVIDTVTYVAALAAMKWIPTVKPDADKEQSTLQAMAEGLRFAVKTRVLLWIFVIDLIAMIFGMPRAVFPELADKTFDKGAFGAGLLYSAPSVGALLAALLSGWVKNVNRQGLAVILAVLAWGAAITLAGLSVFSLALTLLFLALAGAADVVSAVFRGTILLDATPDHLRGRVSSVNLMVVIGGPRLGDVEAGFLASAVGGPASVVFGGLACLVGAGALGIWAPALRDHRGTRAVDPEEPEAIEGATFS